MKVDHRLLHRMQLVAVGEVLHGDDFGAVGLTSQQDAGVDRLVDDPAAGEAPQHHGAGAAVALGAAFLGAGRALVETEVIQQCQSRRDILQANGAPASQELDVLTHQGLIRTKPAWLPAS